MNGTLTCPHGHVGHVHTWDLTTGSRVWRGLVETPDGLADYAPCPETDPGDD